MGPGRRSREAYLFRPAVDLWWGRERTPDDGGEGRKQRQRATGVLGTLSFAGLKFNLWDTNRPWLKWIALVLTKV